MYKLKCPSCHRVATAPFVRVGSVATCSQCGKRYRIREVNVRRSVRIQPVAPGTEDPLLPGVPPAPASGESRAALVGEVTGLSGLSRLMEEAERAGPDPTDEHDPSAPEPEDEQTPEQPTPPAKPPRRHQRSTYLVITGSGVAAALLVVAIWLASQLGTHKHGLKANAKNLGTEVAITTDTAADTTHAVVVSGERLDARSWTVFNTPKQAIPPADHDLVTLDDQAIDRAHNALFFTAVVVNGGQQVISRAWVQLTLLDHAGQAVAETRLSVALIAPGHDEPIRVRLPAITTLNSRVVASVQVPEFIPHAVALEQTMNLGMTGSGPNTTVVIAATNPADQSLKRMCFLVTAVDRDQQPLARWLITWNHPVAPDLRVRLQTRTPMPKTITVANWLVRAVGQQ